MDSGDEDELTIGSRDFYKMREKLFKAGYVEGATTAEEKAQETFYPHQTILSRVYVELGKLVGVVESAISISPETEEVLKPFLSKLDAYAAHLRGRSNPNQEPTGTHKVEVEVSCFVEEFKCLYPESAPLVDALFNDKDALPPVEMDMEAAGCGDSNCKCINGISVDMNKLRF